MPKTHRKRSLYAIAISVVLLGSGWAGFQLTRPSSKPTGLLQSAAADRPHDSPPAAVDLPVRLKIPKLEIDAALDHVGLTKSGDVEVPKGPDNAGWYNKSPRPGELGSAVIDGHFGWRGGKPAVFDNLHKLQKGDKLYVEDKKGQTITFVVRELQTFGPEEKAPDVFISNDKKSHLNLITCHGDWDKTQKSYSKRLVVFTDRIF